MAPNEGISMPAVSGVGNGLARESEVTGPGPAAVECSVQSCQLFHWTDSQLALTLQQDGNEKVRPTSQPAASRPWGGGVASPRASTPGC